MNSPGLSRRAFLFYTHCPLSRYHRSCFFLLDLNNNFAVTYRLFVISRDKILK
jgi:hypothetical protein